MPPEVDLTARLKAIAEATLQLARDEGPRGVTVRAVSEKLGGSTTLITKYLPSRRALLRNAFDYAAVNWAEDLAATLGDKSGREKLRALSTWSLQTVGYDDAIRALWISALAGEVSGEPADGTTPQEEARGEYDFIKEAVLEAGHDEWVADALFLAFRGYYLSSVEDPEAWPSERAERAVRRMLDAIDRMIE